MKKWIGLWLVFSVAMLPGWVMADPVDKLERVNSLIATRIADVLDLEPHKADRLRFVLIPESLRAKGGKGGRSGSRLPWR